MLLFRLCFLGIVLLGLTGCGGSEETPALESTLNELNTTTLAVGNQPVLGTEGPKQTVLINNETDFSSFWYQYTNEALPLVDFTQYIVLLDDRGELDLNYNCGFFPKVKEFQVNKNDDENTVIHVILERSCRPEGTGCASVINYGRPYVFVKILKGDNRVDNVMVSESIVGEECP
jgi:hypothetical protein